MRSRSLSVLLAIVLWLGAAAAPHAAQARREDHFSYPFGRVWTTAIRLVRVDLECPITEKDRDEGYFFFDYKDGSKTYPGSIELIPTKEDGVDGVRVVVQVPAMPSYVEALVLDRLSRRLVEDFGMPKEPAAPTKPNKPEQAAPGAGNSDTGGKPSTNGKAPAQSAPSQDSSSSDQKPR